jgi:hypothetical protein
LPPITSYSFRIGTGRPNLARIADSHFEGTDMNKLIAAAIALALLGAAAVQAAPHHTHRVCAVRHHHKTCHWR